MFVAQYQHMQIKRSLVPLFLFSLLSFHTRAQPNVSIPAYTAYAFPAEESDSNGDSRMFSEANGLQNWTDAGREVQFFFRLRSTGKLNLSLLIKNNEGGNKLRASVAGKTFIINVPRSGGFRRLSLGSVEIRDTGFYSLRLSAIAKRGNTIADIRSLELGGPAVQNIHFNQKTRRNSASVHLFYPLPDSVKALSFYNEVTIPKDADMLHSYYMACGFARGYFGIQVNSNTERRVIFSVWDAGTEADDRNKVAEENKVQLIAKGEDVFADGFGNEGTGGHSHWVYNWKTGVTYKFLVTAVTDSASNSTTYAGYFFTPETEKWKLIACFKAPKDGKPLRHLYSFVENFEGNNGQLYRKAYFGNTWARRESGEWKEITESSFSYDATGKAGDRIDYGAGIDSNNRFELWNGGFRSATAHYGQVFARKPNGIKPVADLYKNADSAIELAKEKALMLEAIRLGKMDTTGSTNGVFYKILKEGDGDAVSVDDTVVVHYKGMLMNGSVFDETKEKPATFPLKRLIRGWQAGLPHCRKGGKIRMMIPSSMAYTIRNLGIIPPNSILIFDVEVLEIKRLKP